MAEEGSIRRLAAILAADVVGYARLSRTDEDGARAAFNLRLEQVFRPTVAAHGGRIVKTIGDGILAEFPSVVGAVRAAVAAQEALAGLNRDATPDTRMDVRMGINLGDVIVEGEDIHGDGVNVASRLEALAEPGGICISSTVFEEVRNRLPLQFRDMGPQRIKNIDEPVLAYRLVGASVPRVRSPSAWRKNRSWRNRAIAAALALVVVVAGSAWWWLMPDVAPASRTGMAYPLPEKPSIAVLPFANISGDPEQEYFADGLTEDIITNLASLPNLFVIARNSTNKYKGQSVDIRDVSQDLGVRYVLEGSVRRADNTLRITAQLIDALSGTHLWAETYDRELKDVFELQDEITREVGRRLASEVIAAEFERRSRRGTESIEAYDLFLRGRQTMVVLSPQSIADAVPLFEKAVELDPGYARAWAGLATARAQPPYWGWPRGPEDTFEHAEELALKAVNLDSDDEYCLTMLGSVYRIEGKYDEAIEAYQTALIHSPSNPDILIALALAKALGGHAEEAIANANLAFRLNPNAPAYYFAWRGIVHYVVGDFEKGLEDAKRFNELNPKLHIGYFWLALSYAQLGQDVEAAEARKALLERAPWFSVRGGYLKQNRARGIAEERILDGARKAGIPEVASKS